MNLLSQERIDIAVCRLHTPRKHLVAQAVVRLLY